jgi:hypothetical protein
MSATPPAVVITRRRESRTADSPDGSTVAVGDLGFRRDDGAGLVFTIPIGWRRPALGPSALVPADVITGLVPVIPVD